MAVYRYPYQKIVDLKTSEKTQAEWMLSAAVGKLRTEEFSLEELGNERMRWYERLLEAARIGTPLAELRLLQDYIDYLDGAIAGKHRDVENAKQEVARSQRRLSDRMVDEKVWLKAKEKALEAFKQTMQAKEQNELDEMATVRYVLPAR